MTASGSYKNIKDTGVENTYRITKIAGELTVNITTEKNETTEPDDTESVQILIGDTNLDGRVSIKDVTAIQRHCADINVFSSRAKTAADVDGDGSVTIDDATAVQRYLVHFKSGCGNCGTVVEVTD